MTYQIINADCIESMRGLEPASVDFVFTDPPYGHNNNNGDLIHKREQALGLRKTASKSRSIHNDGPEANHIFQAALVEIARVLKPGCCCCCCCGGGGPDPQFARWSLWIDDALEFKQMVVWDKGPIGMGWHYRRSYESVLVAMKPGAACKWYDTSQRIENIIRPSKNMGKIIPSASQHPTEKPSGLAAHFIGLHTAPGDLVLDPFCGSGSTGEAAVKLGRNFIGVDSDPQWTARATRRLDALSCDMFIQSTGTFE